VTKSDGDPDLGIFGPDSVTWRLYREPIFYLGGLRAIFLEALHPRSIAGVVQNANLRLNGFDRVMRGFRHFNTVAWAPAAEVRRASRRVRASHARATARDSATGEVYHVDDQELLLWVHVTNVESFMTTARLTGAKFTDADVDQYYEEWLAGAELVGIDPTTVPTTAAAVEAYYESMRPTLRLSAEGLETKDAMFHPILPTRIRIPFALRWWQSAVSMAFGLTPEWARQIYGYRGRPVTTTAARSAATALRLMLKVTPPKYYRSPLQVEAERRVRARAATTVAPVLKAARL
jgi:uncharacterized protein (DUF2236 family)